MSGARKSLTRPGPERKAGIDRALAHARTRARSASAKWEMGSSRSEELASRRMADAKDRAMRTGVELAVLAVELRSVIDRPYAQDFSESRPESPEARRG
jgi:hypothetical protein